MSKIFGIGTDILEIQRFEAVLNEHGEKFIQKLFTSNEIAYCTKFKDPKERYTARFCAKEAVAKSLGTGFGEHLRFHDIEILNEESGKPFVRLSKPVLRKFQFATIEISISHTKNVAVAIAIAEKPNLFVRLFYLLFSDKN
jgi:holo-[acyl-carrier protein] synthase